MNAVTTLSLGYFSANSATPEGLAIKFKNRMRCSGTPLSFSTSTAKVADPPLYSVSRAVRSKERRLCLELTSGEHGIKEENPSVSNISRKLVIEKLGHAGLLISLDQDLADPN